MPKTKLILLEIEEYERQQAKLLSKLNEAEEAEAVKTGEEWHTIDDLKKIFGV